MRTLEEDLLHPGEDELVQLMDGELPEEVQASLREHIEGCGVCRERLDELDGGGEAGRIGDLRGDPRLQVGTALAHSPDAEPDHEHEQQQPGPEEHGARVAAECRELGERDGGSAARDV